VARMEHQAQHHSYQRGVRQGSQDSFSQGILDAVGHQRLLCVPTRRFEPVLMTPVKEWGFYRPVSQLVPTIDFLPKSYPFQPNSELPHRELKFIAYPCRHRASDFFNPQGGRGNFPDVTRILVKRKDFLW